MRVDGVITCPLCEAEVPPNAKVEQFLEPDTLTCPCGVSLSVTPVVSVAYDIRQVVLPAGYELS